MITHKNAVHLADESVAHTAFHEVRITFARRWCGRCTSTRLRRYGHCSVLRWHRCAKPRWRWRGIVLRHGQRAAGPTSSIASRCQGRRRARGSGLIRVRGVLRWITARNCRHGRAGHASQTLQWARRSRREAENGGAGKVSCTRAHEERVRKYSENCFSPHFDGNLVL